MQTRDNACSIEHAVGTLSLERLPAVKARTGLSRSSIYARIATGEFPAPIKRGVRTSAWDARSVDGWIRERIAAGAAKAAP